MRAFWMVSAFALCFGCTFTELEQKKESAKLETGVKTPEEGKKEISTEDLAAVVEGNNRFAFDLYHQLGQKPGNKFFSPYSISTALGMTYAGARGITAKEMAQTLHFTLENERLHPEFGELIRKINGGDKKRNYELDVANSLWGAKGLSLEPKFLGITQTDYQAGFQSVDFAKNPEGARQIINGWVEDKTNKKIEDLIPKGLITGNTRLVLVNAIYFRADWAMPFPEKRTWPEDFTIPGAPAFKVPMMHHTFEANYMENADFQLAEFIYKDKEVSMVVMLPKKKDGLAEVEKKLSAKAMAEALSAARPARLQVSLPKFKLTEEFSLGNDLAALGMKDAFGPKADFSGISRSESMSISAVVHKAFVEVDEKGTEAAAGTGVIMAKKGAPPSTPFRADQPYFFVLRHNATGNILFMGRVFDPRG
jgi:serpin B